jgi:flavin-dependent dehydrogenase
MTFDYVIGADGAQSIIRRAVQPARVREDFTQTLGYYPTGAFEQKITVQYLTKGNGYLWAFPRPDHLSLGIGCDLGIWTTKDLWKRVDQFAKDVYGNIDLEKAPRFSALIPNVREDTLEQVDAEGPGWALCGDALGLVDPITREGIISALETARGLADALSDGVVPGRYTVFVQKEIIPEIRRAARLKSRFFRPRFTELMVVYTERSEAIRRILADLASGNTGYLRLKRRLVMRAFPVAVQYLMHKFSRRLPRSRASHLSP